jgi:uncharacterized surface protein with fasciclin (FAS1) repeats
MAKSIIETASDAGSFNTLVAAVKAAGSPTRCRAPALYRLRPTDDAFAALPAGTVEGSSKTRPRWPRS